MALTKTESAELARLLRKAKWPIPKDVFQALVNKTVSVPIELAVLNKTDRILMFYRKDEEYDGYHIPGTVVRDDETVKEAVQRLQSEVVGGATNLVRNIGWTEIPKGSGAGENPTRHEISLLWMARIEGEYRGNGDFFSLDHLPQNTLSHHHVLIGKFKRFLETGQLILGS